MKKAQLTKSNTKNILKRLSNITFTEEENKEIDKMVQGYVDNLNRNM